MAKIDETRMMRDIAKLMYGKNEESFSLEKFFRTIEEAPIIDRRLIEGKTDE